MRRSTSRGTRRFETPRLILRPLTRRDVRFYFRHFSIPEIVEGQAYPAPRDLEAAGREVERFILLPRQNGTGFRWAIMLKGRRGPIGTCGFYNRDGDRAEIGYDLRPELWGRGLMHEALVAMLGRLFREEGLRRVVATVPTWNRRSMRVLRRLGFRRQGLARARSRFRGQTVDDVVFVLAKEGWAHIA